MPDKPDQGGQIPGNQPKGPTPGGQPGKESPSK